MRRLKIFVMVWSDKNNPTRRKKFEDLRVVDQPMLHS